MEGMGEHRAAYSWLEDRYRDPGELVCLSWAAIYGFVRLVSSRRVMGSAAVKLDRSWRVAGSFVDQENARLIEAGPGHAGIAGELIATPGLTSNDVPDVQAAALAIEHGLTLCSHDRGFARFERLSWLDPLTDQPRSSGARAPEPRD